MAARTTVRPQPPPMAGAARPRSRDATIAGMLLSLAGAAILLGFITAEALYPGTYTTHADTVSHLGASEPPNSVVLQPSAAIFDLTMLVTGAMILAGAWFAYRALRRTRQGRHRALDRLPDRPVAGRLRQLPAGRAARGRRDHRCHMKVLVAYGSGWAAPPGSRS
jgi:hypothetical protein